jgi:hypothetical protein
MTIPKQAVTTKAVKESAKERKKRERERKKRERERQKKLKAFTEIIIGILKSPRARFKTPEQMEGILNRRINKKAKDLKQDFFPEEIEFLHQVALAISETDKDIYEEIFHRFRNRIMALGGFSKRIIKLVEKITTGLKNPLENSSQLNSISVEIEKDANPFIFLEFWYTKLVMSFSIGIIGLPNVGKSTLFKALTKQSVDISNYPFCTIDPNVGVVAVPDERLEAIAQVVQPEKITPTVIEFVDIAGLVKNAHQGEGLGNQFLARIREVDALCHIVRAFANEKIAHVEGQINPQRDIEIINTELIMKDLETVNKRLEKTKKQARSGDKKLAQELEVLNKIKKILEQGKLIISEQRTINNEQLIKELGLLTAKPMIYVLNSTGHSEQSEESRGKNSQSTESFVASVPQDDNPSLSLDLKSEAELSELTPEEIQELELLPSQLDQLIKTCYQALNLITFYTITGGQEARAWTLKNGSKAPQAGGVVHSDFEEKFIRAEVINWQKLIEAGSWQTAREKGLLRTEGKEYLVQDGDVIEFKI